jgi:hypothetical protein
LDDPARLLAAGSSIGPFFSIGSVRRRFRMNGGSAFTRSF